MSVLLRRILVLAVVVTTVACGTRGADFRLGGALGASGSIVPIPGGGVSADVFLGLGDVEAASWTEFSIFPYSMGSETLSVSLIRDWLSLGAEYTFSLVPIGITSATILARAVPAPWQEASGDLLLDLSVRADARLTGYAFASVPLRTEMWIQGAASVSRSLGFLDQVMVGASLEATLSAPGGGRIWPTPIFLASASIGRVTLESGTTLALAPELRVASETLTLRASWSELGVSAEMWCTFSDEQGAPSAGLRVAVEFGDVSRGPSPMGSECSGGVCR